MIIKKLSAETINLISAGEVIEGPSDILKELLENSIDAEASEIEVTIKNSGIDFLQVKDNGTGISKEDLQICTERHTTSKLNKIDDLYLINSFGFRGEALASINAVSHLTIISSVSSTGKGYILENNILTETNSNKGTLILIKDLFYNLPVRKKFLKSKQSEYSQIYDLFLAFVLRFPEIRFVFNSERKNIVFQKTNQENRFLQLFGPEIKNKTINISLSNELFELSGIVSNPKDQFYFPTNFLFINNRLVYSTIVQKTIISVYRDYLMVQQKPFFVLFLKFNSNTIDINVHPKKRIVKIQNELLFLSILKSMLENKLYPVVEEDVQSKNLFQYTSKEDGTGSHITYLNYEPKIVYEYLSSTKSNYFDSNNSLQTKIITNNAPIFESQNHSSDLILNNNKIIKILGQIKNTYVVCETTNGFLLIDQHAAAERINLEKNRLVHSLGFTQQKLLIKKLIPVLSENHKLVLDTQKKVIQSLGFDYVLDGDKYYLITIPKLFNQFFDDDVLVNLLDDLASGDDSVNKLKDNLIKLFTCKNSIKANAPLSFSDQLNLIKDLEKCIDKTICAHGRPTMLQFTLNDLEKIFKRIV